ncbi:CPXCG motif-containing cysteine-rich protein [Neptunicella sp.]|uniref:CPXCG motif-containing cysteine-rich protein n=1 Tax=Neptunicella sp. TaxID=2125986 RepID=UPI003F68D1B7
MDTKHKIIECPHCGHKMHIDLDYSNGDQDYFEDCTNCCNPIHLNLHINELRHTLELNISSDDEQIY